MSGLRGLLGVAHYERILLMRTTRYRFLGAVGIGIPIFIGVVLAIAEAQGAETGTTFGVGAFVPFYVYSFLQTVVIAFIAGDFRAADERAQVYEVIAVRPLSTTQLVVGKYLGILQGLMLLSLAVMTVTVSVQAAKLSVLGTPFRIEPYLGYLLLMNLPALIYMTALTFCLGAILRNRTAAALVALGYAFACLVFLGERYGGIFDFGAFYAPLFYSDMLGFGDLTRVIELRLFYIAAAVVLLGIAVERYPRLPQQGFWRWGGRAVAATALVACVGIALGIRNADAGDLAQRADFLRAHVTRAEVPGGAVVHYDMRITLHEGDTPLAAEISMLVRNPNPEPVDELVFGLNPGLAIETLTGPGGADLTHEHDGAVVAIDLPAPLASGEETEIRIAYRGDIDRNGFDLIRTAPRREREDGPLRMPELTAWVRPDTVFLPARAGWYPRSGVDYGYSEPPPPSFATATIEVDSPMGLQVVTQGAPTGGEPEGGRHVTRFAVNRPVPLFTLNGGRYDVFEARIGDVDMALYIDPEHVSTIAFFDDAADEVRSALEQMLEAIVRETGLPYPYARLNVVEVPHVVQWYYEGWREAGGLTAPSVLMIEESVLTQRNLQRSFNWRQRSADGEFDAAAVKRDLLISEVFQLFMSPESERYGIFRSPLVQLWSYDRAFTGDRSNLLERGMPVYLQQDVGSEVRSMMLSGGSGRPRIRSETAIASAEMVAAASDAGQRAAETGSDWNAVLEAMQRETFAEMNPDVDPELYRSVVDAKGVSIFRMMRAVAGADAFVNAIEGFAEDSQHTGVDFAEFEAAVTSPETAAEGASTAEPEADPTEVGEPEMERLIQSWLEGTAVPGYMITRASVNKLEDSRGQAVHQVVVRVRNGEPALGFVRINAVGFEDEVSKGIQIEGNSEVEVAILITDRPVRVTVDPFFAKNRRSLVAPLRVPDFVQEDPPIEYVREVPDQSANLVEIIVDNEDDGFSMPTRRVQRFLRPGLEGGQWWVRQTLFAYGRYENNYRMKSAGDGAQPAIWTATMPREGAYDVAYYFLPEATAWARSGVWGLASSFEITIHHRGEVHTLNLDTAELDAGWNLLGRFDFEAGAEVSVELSDRANGRLYADAVRWRLADSDLVYEEDISPWEVQRGSISRR